MLNPYQMYGTDKSLEENGVELDFGGFAITVARAGGANKRYKAMLDMEMRPHRRALQNNALDPALADQIMIRVFATTVVKDWRGVTNREGEEIPFSKENVVALFTDLPELFQEVLNQSMQISNFVRQEVAEDAKK